uniref:tetratricopeptide repeat protein n=1 Tax=Thaumasiovibrio occultus TaxID=1891184 RepID=UPI000B3598B1|nr:tetratricopeptide repeat protein [Thaumasiovibrio occultus]
MEAYALFQQKLGEVVSYIQQHGFGSPDIIVALLEVLDELEQEGQGFATPPEEMRVINYYTGLVYCDHYAGKEEALQRLRVAEQDDEKTPFLSPAQRLKLTLVLGALNSRAGNIDQALVYFGRVVEEVNKPTAEPDTRIGGLREVAYYYHEMEMYPQALALNLTVRQICQAHFPDELEVELGIVQNIVENYYCLGDAEKTELHLNQVLQMAMTVEDDEVLVSSLFKFGVLKFEQGDTEQAKALMQQSLRAAEVSGDEDLIDMAQANLDVLEEKML